MCVPCSIFCLERMLTGRVLALGMTDLDFSKCPMSFSVSLRPLHTYIHTYIHRVVPSIQKARRCAVPWLLLGTGPPCFTE